MKKFSWLIVAPLLCLITSFVWTESHVCSWFDTLLKRSGCLGQLNSAGMVTGMAFSPNGQTLVTLSGDRSIRLWDVNDMTVGHILPDFPVNLGISWTDYTMDGLPHPYGSNNLSMAQDILRGVDSPIADAVTVGGINLREMVFPHALTGR